MPVEKVVHLFINNIMRLFGRLLARLQIFINDILQIIDRIKIDIVQ
jgi:hypothetical protein